LFPAIAFHDQHNLPRKDSLTLEEIRRIQKVEANHNTVHGYHLNKEQMKLAHNFHFICNRSKSTIFTYRKFSVELPTQGELAVRGKFHEISDIAHGFPIQLVEHFFLVWSRELQKL
jgi:hypothetical protein